MRYGCSIKVGSCIQLNIILVGDPITLMGGLEGY